MVQEPGFPEHHYEFMRLALEQAERALQLDEVPVGCVFVRDEEIICRGMNDTNRSLNGTRHAEIVCMEQMLQTNPVESFRDTDLYVTVEPCIMCASALRQLQIRAVYYGCTNDRFGGNGGVLAVHSDPAVDEPYPSTGGIYRQEAIVLLQRFYIQENAKAPEPRPKKDRQMRASGY